MLARSVKHLVFPRWRLRRNFPAPVLMAIERAIRASESAHTGEIRFAIESALQPVQLWRGLTARARAIDVFSELRVWDTARNNGVLIYLLLADHDVEIVADRGISGHVTEEQWRDICASMEQSFRAGDFQGGALAGIEAAGRLLAQHFPAARDNDNELPDRPSVR